MNLGETIMALHDAIEAAESEYRQSAVYLHFNSVEEEQYLRKISGVTNFGDAKYMCNLCYHIDLTQAIDELVIKKKNKKYTLRLENGVVSCIYRRRVIASTSF